jgi:hypothetical protein
MVRYIGEHGRVTREDWTDDLPRPDEIGVLSQPRQLPLHTVAAWPRRVAKIELLSVP